MSIRLPTGSAPIRRARAPQPWTASRVWALAGVTALMATGVYRLAERGAAAVRGGLSPLEWAVLLGLTAGMIWFEGFRGIQQRFVPRVHRRAARVHARRLRWRLAAPLYAMSLVGGRRRMVWKARLGIAAIVGAVLLIRSLPEPWRGIVDVAVAVALGWGLVALLLYPFRKSASAS